MMPKRPVSASSPLAARHPGAALRLWAVDISCGPAVRAPGDRPGSGAGSLARRRLVSAAVVLALLALLGTRPASAREGDFRRFPDYVWLLLGAGVGLVVHESGHLLFDAALNTEPKIVGVKLGPFPFFAIEPTRVRNNQQRYVIAQAGTMMESIYSEAILQADPHIREQKHAFLKGMLLFHVVLDAGYAITGLAGIGPAQSDVNTMSRALGVPPWGIGIMLMVPAVVDTYRYFMPESRWAPWVSLGTKLTMVGAGFAF